MYVLFWTRIFSDTYEAHQIRVHLQYLGYPIANDPVYCNKIAWVSDPSGVVRLI
jgi:23S rRNA-/tRNA-specific pseudouridylate synthase